MGNKRYYQTIQALGTMLRAIWLCHGLRYIIHL